LASYVIENDSHLAGGVMLYAVHYAYLKYYLKSPDKMKDQLKI